MTARHLLFQTALAVVITTPASAQRFDDRDDRDRPSVSFLAGAAHYDAQDNGTAFTGAIRFNIPTGRLLSIEPGVGLLRYDSPLGGTITYILPEFGLQVRPHSGAVRPYAGGGIGFSEFLSGRGTSYFTLHAAAGVVASVGDVWGIRGDVRARTIDPFRQKSVELTVGVTRQLGR